MAEQQIVELRLTAVMKAAGDPSRRRVLTLLARDGPQKVSDLASRFEISLNAISKHIKVLEAAGLVRRKRAWRDHVIEAEIGGLEVIDSWLAALRWVFETREERRANADGSDRV